MKKYYFPGVLLAIYIIVFIWSAISPVDYSVWVAEAITSLVPIVLLLVLFFFRIRLSNFAYFLMAIFPVMHIVGAHYTFANVPFDWFNHMFGFSRNMYDRVAHFTVGFYAFGTAEILYSLGYVKNKFVAVTYGLFMIMAIAAAYEIFEWQYAVSADPSAGIAVLGAQGDIWDAQKDMLMDTLGAITGIVLFLLSKKQRAIQ
jgi:putative membrane protein